MRKQHTTRNTWTSKRTRKSTAHNMQEKRAYKHQARGLCKADGRARLGPNELEANPLFYLGQFLLGPIRLRPRLRCLYPLGPIRHKPNVVFQLGPIFSLSWNHHTLCLVCGCPRSSGERCPPRSNRRWPGFGPTLTKTCFGQPDFGQHLF